MKNVTELVARGLLGIMFVMAGIGKIGAGYAGTMAYMDAMGVPGSLLPLVIALEIVGGAMVITGFKVEWAAYALAAFSLLAGLLFHANFADQMQAILFMKNIAIVGGLMILAVNGAAGLSVDSYFKQRS